MKLPDVTEQKMICPYCKEEKLCIYAPDPFASEIKADDTPVWECRECRYQST